jgi:WD40 repeat protein
MFPAYSNCSGINSFPAYTHFWGKHSMSLFLDFPCTFASESKVITVKWCFVERICAISTNDHCISFYMEEGLALQNCKISREEDASAIAWHPHAKVMATGWEDGHVAVWEVTVTSEDAAAATCIFSANSKFCRIPIRIITWGPSATRLVTGDASGAVLIWKVSIGPQSVPKNSHRLTFVVIFQFTKRFQLALVLHRS